MTFKSRLTLSSRKAKRSGTRFILGTNSPINARAVTVDGEESEAEESEAENADYGDAYRQFANSGR